MNEKVVVVGAGIVGMCCALKLQESGFRVYVFDPVSPGESCSQGNAGGIALGEVVPNALPGVLRRVPAYLIDPNSPLSVRWRYFPRAIPWLCRFVASASPRNIQRIADALFSIVTRALEDYSPLFSEAKVEHLVHRKGMIIVYESEAALRADDEAWQLMRNRNLRLEHLDSSAIHDLEPDIYPGANVGLFDPSMNHVSDPLALVRSFAQLFTQRGGSILKKKVTGFAFEHGKPSAVTTDTEVEKFDHVVIAAGAWSHKLSRMLGSTVPLETERGYNVTFANPGVQLNRIVTSSDKFSVTPMAMGLRAAGIVELAGLNAAPNWRLASSLVSKAKNLLPALNICEAANWMGHRPGLPDTIPIISHSPYFNNVYYAFGHGHLGLTMGGTTGRLIADLVMRRKPPIDLTPFRVDRYA